MYNHQLDAFIRVAQLGSFTKAAEAFYVTPSAMIQQINSLEKELGVQLFLRTRKGVRLTPAGEYLLRESRAFIEKSREIRVQVRKIQETERSCVRIGTNLLHKMRMFGPLWQAFKKTHPDCELQIVDTTGRTKVMETDLVECVKDGEPWQRGLAFLQLSEEPIVLAVPLAHPAAQLERLTFEDMRQTAVVTIKRCMSDELDRLNDELRARGVRVIEVDIYDMSVFSMCEVNGYFLQIPACWSDLYGGMKAIPCAWDYALPYGFFFEPKPTGALHEFIRFLEEKDR